GRGASIVALLNWLSQRFVEVGRRPRSAGTASAVVALPGLTKTGLRRNHRDQFVNESFRMVRKKTRARRNLRPRHCDGRASVDLDRNANPIIVCAVFC